MKRFLLLMLCGAVLLGLCSCGVKSAQEPGTAAPVDTEFVSDDGTIRVRLHGSDADDIPAAMPVLRARPQVITLGMARRMAEGVFGDAEFFEFSEELSKAEIADMIAVYEYAVTDEAIRAAHGDAPQAWIDSVRDVRLNILEYYRNAYAVARDEVTPVPCLWRFWPVEHYSVHGHDYAGTDPSYTDDIPAGVSVDLRAVTTVDGVPYELWVNNNERADFRNHSLSIFSLVPDELLDSCSGDERTAREREWLAGLGLLSAAPADEAELDAACERAARLTTDMGLGEWRFTANAEEWAGGSGGWQIALTGQPVYEGFPVNWRNPSRDTSDLERMTIHTANDGSLIHLQYVSPMEIISVEEPAAPLKTWDEISKAAAQAMRGWGYDTLIPNYASEKVWWDEVGAVVSDVSVDIDSVRVGYACVPCGASDYLLIPAASFVGTLDVTGSIPGVHESPMNLLLDDDGRRDAYLTIDLRTASALK